MEKGEQLSKDQWQLLYSEVEELLMDAVIKGKRSTIIPKRLLIEHIREELGSVGVKVSALPVDLYGEWYEVSW